MLMQRTIVEKFDVIKYNGKNAEDILAFATKYGSNANEITAEELVYNDGTNDSLFSDSNDDFGFYLQSSQAKDLCYFESFKVGDYLINCLSDDTPCVKASYRELEHMGLEEVKETF